MAKKRLESMLEEFKDSISKRVDKLSSRVNLYTVICSLGIAAIPVYGQIKTALADSQIDKAVTAKIEPAVVRAAELAATKAVQKLKEKQYCE